MRRLRRQEQLPVGAAGDDGVRAQDTHPPDELQLRHDVSWKATARRSPSSPSTSAAAKPVDSDRGGAEPPDDPADGSPEPDPDGADRRVHRPPLRHRRHRRGHGQPDPRHGGDARGRTVRGLDQTGLSQKAGPVVSDLRISASGTPMSNRANSAGVDCFLAFDLLVAASDTHRTGARADRTIVIGSAAPTPTGAMVAQPTTPYPELDVLTGRLAEVSRSEANRYPNASAITSGLFGDATTANMFLLGVAVQAGAIPSRAQRRSSGRSSSTASPCSATSPRCVGAGGGTSTPTRSSRPPASCRTPQPETLDELIDRLAADLTDYQSARYADRFRRIVAKARQAEQRVDRRVARVHRRRRPQPAQADGVQGRVRGRPPAPAAGVTRCLRGGRRAEARRSRGACIRRHCGRSARSRR